MDASQLPESDPNIAVRTLPDSDDRLPRACERCWKRKQKCDRKAPVCSSCQESNATCHPRIVTVDVETLPNASSKNITHVAGYVASLKRKTEELRSEFQTKRARIEEVTAHNSNGAPTGYGHSSSIASPFISSPSASRRGGSITSREVIEEDDGSVHAAMGEIGYLSLSAMAEPRDSSASHAQPLSLRTILRAAGNLRGSEPYTGSLSSMTTTQVNRSDMLANLTTITRTQTVQFVEHFLDEFCMRIPALSEGYIMPLYDSLFSTESSGHKIGSSTALNDLLVYNVIAIGILYSPRRTELQLLASNLHDYALDNMPISLEKEDSVLVLQFQLSLIIYSLYSSSGGSAWHFLGIMMRRLIALGYHREPEMQDHVGDKETDMRRWLFWSAYILDRQLSSTMDRPYAIQDVEITLRDSLVNQSFVSPINQHILAHARLLSAIQNPNDEDALFNWYNLTSWQSDTPVPRTMYDRLNYHSRYLQQLACRGIVQLVDIRWLGDSLIRGINGSSLQDAIRHNFGEFIQGFHDRIEEENFPCSFIDAYDIFSIGVIYLLLSSKTQRFNPDLSEFTSKCSTILTIIAQNFRPLTILKKVLWTLNSAIASRNTFHSTHASPPTQVTEMPAILANPPPAIPHRIGELIRKALSSENAMEMRRR